MNWVNWHKWYNKNIICSIIFMWYSNELIQILHVQLAFTSWPPETVTLSLEFSVSPCHSHGGLVSLWLGLTACVFLKQKLSPVAVSVRCVWLYKIVDVLLDKLIFFLLFFNVSRMLISVWLDPPIVASRTFNPSQVRNEFVTRAAAAIAWLKDWLRINTLSVY